MKKNIIASSSSGMEVKYYHQVPGIPLYANQRTAAGKKINDPASACFTSCRYPIPSIMAGRVRSSE